MTFLWQWSLSGQHFSDDSTCSSALLFFFTGAALTGGNLGSLITTVFCPAVDLL